MSQTVSALLVGVVEQTSNRFFGSIGDSLNPLADAARRSKIEWIGVRYEEGAALAAAGRAKLTGRIGVCAGTTGPGSTHLVAGLYEAGRNHAPVLALSDDMPRKMQGTDFHPDHRARSVVSRRLALYRNHLNGGTGASRYPSGHRRRLCRPRRRASDASAGRDRREGGWRGVERGDLEAAIRVHGKRERHCRNGYAMAKIKEAVRTVSGW
jgi:hypothetical protein